jgi:hypothetical protein
MKRILSVVFILLSASAPVFAHHALATEYDPAKVITLKGKLVEIDWRNPHPHFFLDVAEANGQVTRWKIAAATPNMLVRFRGGWTRDKVFRKLNDEITVKGWKSRDGMNRAYGDLFTFSDGSTMQMGIGLGGGGAGGN